VERKIFIQQLEEIESLPTLPIIAQKIQQLISNDRSNMAQIASFISKDQAISSRVIRLVNSAFFGLRNRVASIQQAIVLLGLNTITNIVMGISVVKVFSENSTGSIFDREMFWFHAFGTAMGAKMIARELGRDEPEDYFLAGLLHDIGILVLDQFFHDEFVDVLKNMIEYKIDLLESEHKMFGTTHQETGAYLATKWKLPSILIHSIRYHHNPFTVPNETTDQMKDISLIVHIADIAASNKGIHFGLPSGQKKYESDLFSIIKIREKDIDTIFITVDAEVRSLAKEWGI
jgi:putative nucleotidyltransferase with HDIG domain